MNTAINSEAFATLKAYLHPDVKIIDCEVHNSWLVATLSSGVIFRVKNG